MSSIAPSNRSNPSSPSATTVASTPGWLRPLLRVDAVGSVVIGLALAVAAGWLQPALALGSWVPILVVAGLFVVNGPVNAAAARRLSRTTLLGPIAIDTLFGVAMLAVAIADPSGAQVWARWAVAIVAVASFDLAVAKAWGRARLPA